MALHLVPYNNSMRLGISDFEDSQPLFPREGAYAPSAKEKSADLVVSDPKKRTIKEIADSSGLITTINDSSQIVTYSSKYVTKLSDISNDLNISSSLSIKYGMISGGGSGSYVNTETFQQSDINFLVTVKVIKQTMKVKDQLQFWPIKGKAASKYTPKEFTDIYGDSFISGFQEGGQFSAIVSIRALDSSNLADIRANAHLVLQSGIGSINSDTEFKSKKEALNKLAEINITVNWWGGGKLKESEKQWTIETLQDVAAKFPDLVANCPQRTHAILTKYTSLRTYLQWRDSETLQPLNYEIANLYIGDLLDIYMSYKQIWKQVHQMLKDLDGDKRNCLIKALPPSPPVKMPKPLKKDGKCVDREVLQPYEPNVVGLDLALRHVRQLMALLAQENETITQDPSLVNDPTRPIAYLLPQLFKQLLPMHPPSLNVGLISRNIYFKQEEERALYGFPKQTVQSDVIAAFSTIDIRREDTRQISRLSISSQLAEAHKLKFSSRTEDGSAVTTSYQANTETLMIPVNGEGIQGGMWTMPPRMPEASSPKFFSFRQRIDFKYAYETKAPSVVVFLAGFDLETQGHQNVCIYVESVEKTGFYLVVKATPSIRTAVVSWFACPADDPNIVCGTSDAPWASAPWTELDNAPLAEDGFSGHVGFAPRVFAMPPKVFLALRGFSNTQAGINTRVKANIFDITTKDFNWKIDGWATKLSGGAVSWVVWQNE